MIQRKRISMVRTEADPLLPSPRGPRVGVAAIALLSALAVIAVVALSYSAVSFDFSLPNSMLRFALRMEE